MNTARVGWMGGTFDPVHNGHLDVVGAARTALELSEVYLVPARVPPHRGAPIASADDRLAMVTLAAQTQPWLRVSDLELTTTGPSYTSDTLDRLEEQGKDLRSVYVITGADAFADILTWKNAAALLDRCPFVVVSRPGHPVAALPEILPALASKMVQASGYDGASQPVIFLVDAPTAPIASTDVRARVASGLSLEGLVPATVASYIHRHELYQGVA